MFQLQPGQSQLSSEAMPVRNPFLLGLPEGLQVEIYDLPGLNSIQDKQALGLSKSMSASALALLHWITLRQIGKDGKLS